MAPSFALSARRLLALATAAMVAMMVAACGGGGDTNAGSTQSAPTVGPIPEAEFAAVPPPTYAQVIAAYDKVTTANPALLSNEPALSRALFDEIKIATATSGATSTPTASKPAPATRQEVVIDQTQRLTREEWRIVVIAPIRSNVAARTVEPAILAAVTQMPCDADVGFGDGKADAVRHAYWNALMARRTDADFAERFATAHEAASTSAASTAMDLHNNAVGRALAAQFPVATEAQLLELLLQFTFTYAPAGTALPGGTAQLVFIAPAARRAFDARYTGTFTNPDSGAPWAATFNLNQCGTVVRGNFEIVRGAERQQRRFEGVASGESAITLRVVDPYAFESPGNGPVCAGMTMTLTGSLDALGGPWVAANCPLGGQVTLVRAPG